MTRTVLLILLLIVSAVGLVALSLNLNPKEEVTMAPKSLAETTLNLTAPKASASGTLTSDVVINTYGNKVTGVQIELSYDPELLGSFEITQGAFFSANSVELLNKIDTKTGKISYALGNGLGQKGIQGQGVVATLTFRPLKTVGLTSINFDPKSLVSAEGLSQSVLRQALGTNFDLSTFTASPSAK